MEACRTTYSSSDPPIALFAWQSPLAASPVLASSVTASKAVSFLAFPRATAALLSAPLWNLASACSPALAARYPRTSFLS